jgi:hypothetical protein
MLAARRVPTDRFADGGVPGPGREPSASLMTTRATRQRESCNASAPTITLISARGRLPTPMPAPAPTDADRRPRGRPPVATVAATAAATTTAASSEGGGGEGGGEGAAAREAAARAEQTRFSAPHPAVRTLAPCPPPRLGRHRARVRTRRCLWTVQAARPGCIVAVSHYLRADASYIMKPGARRRRLRRP